MKRILLACDLDNTLIHSYKYKRQGDECIEWIKDKEQGFISSSAKLKIEKISRQLIFVPVTTRSILQYSRILWDRIIIPEYALTTNGTILLKNGVVDVAWKQKSSEIAEGYKNDIIQMMELLKIENDYIKCKNVDEMYVFSYYKEGVDIPEKVRKYKELTSLNVMASGKKIYFLPKEFSKGNALRRLKKLVKPDYVISAGDSDIDVQMLEEADLAFCKEELIEQIENENKILFVDENDLLNLIAKVL